MQERNGELFGESFDFLFYDITSTYFEGMAILRLKGVTSVTVAQTVHSLVTSREGLPLAFEIFDGNRADAAITEEMVLIMESKYGKANRIWVMDSGIVSEENMEFMRKRGARYIIGTPKSMLREFEQELLAKGREEVHPGVEVKICTSPDGTEEAFVLCRSKGRKEKETAILTRFVARLEEGLNKLKEQARQGKLRDRQKADCRIGWHLERNSRAASLFDVTVTETKIGKNRRLNIEICKNEVRYQWALQSDGNYLCRR